MHPSDTIAAIASAPGGAARGIVRISGPEAIAIAAASFHSDSAPALHNLRDPTALSGHLQIAQLHSPLPATLYCWPDARSYTRQPTVEVHTLGSPPLLEMVLRHVLSGGARLAEPGEFTLRAFLAGRLDLLQAEAVLGLIDAHGERPFDTALAQLAGGLSTPLKSLREQLLELLAHLEAGLDFATEDIEFIRSEELAAQLGAASEATGLLACQMATRHTSDDLPRVVLYGWPNVGKSSLFNALVGQEHAIVSAQAGTTRDYLAAELKLDGVRFRLIDTAGVEPLEGPTSVAAAAQQMRSEQQAASQLAILCLDSTRPLNAWEQQELANVAHPPIVALTKCDLPHAPNSSEELAVPADAISTSAAAQSGLNPLRQRIAEALHEDASSAGAVASTAARCHESLRRANESLARASSLASAGGYEELVAAEIRDALLEIGKVVGAVYTDDVLDRIFSRFCIGK